MEIRDWNAIGRLQVTEFEVVGRDNRDAPGPGEMPDGFPFETTIRTETFGKGRTKYVFS